MRTAGAAIPSGREQAHQVGHRRLAAAGAQVVAVHVEEGGAGMHGAESASRAAVPCGAGHAPPWGIMGRDSSRRPAASSPHVEPRRPLSESGRGAPMAAMKPQDGRRTARGHQGRARHRDARPARGWWPPRGRAQRRGGRRARRRPQGRRRLIVAVTDRRAPRPGLAAGVRPQRRALPHADRRRRGAGPSRCCPGDGRRRRARPRRRRGVASCSASTCSASCESPRADGPHRRGDHASPSSPTTVAAGAAGRRR